MDETRRLDLNANINSRHLRGTSVYINPASLQAKDNKEKAKTVEPRKQKNSVIAESVQCSVNLLAAPINYAIADAMKNPGLFGGCSE